MPLFQRFHGHPLEWCQPTQHLAPMSTLTRPRRLAQLSRRPSISTLLNSAIARSSRRRWPSDVPDCVRIRTASLRTKVSVAGKRNFVGRDKGPKTPAKVQGLYCRDRARANNPANSGLFAENQEISVSTKVRGGPRRTPTSNQAAMSAAL